MAKEIIENVPENTIISPAKSFKGLSVLIFLWNNKVKLLAVILGILSVVTQTYPELGTSLGGIIIIGEQLYKAWSKEIKEE